MSNACKLLKILSFFFFVVGILSAGMGATALFAGSAAGDITGAMIVSCIVVIVLGVVEIVTACFSPCPSWVGPAQASPILPA